jgi:hypothetical protein
MLTPLNGFPSHQFARSEDIAGPAAGITITPGYGWSTLAVGVGLDATYVASLGAEQFYTPGALLYSASAVGILRPAKPGLVGSLMLGVAGTRLGDVSSPGFADIRQEGMLGPRFGGRLGYEWSNGFGFATTISYARLANDEGEYQPLTLCAQATYSGW